MTILKRIKVSIPNGDKWYYEGMCDSSEVSSLPKSDAATGSNFLVVNQSKVKVFDQVSNDYTDL